MRVQWEYALDVAAGDVSDFEMPDGPDSSTLELQRVAVQPAFTCAEDRPSTVSLDSRTVTRISCEQDGCGPTSAEEGLWLYS